VRTARDQDKIVCQMGRRERDLFLELLALYPRSPVAQRKLSKHSVLPDAEAAQRMLDEALAEQREQNRQLLQDLMLDLARFKVQPTGLKLILSQADTEWLLQVLNEIRVGSWVLLGSPEDPHTLDSVSAETVPSIWAMEMAGYFEMNLLKALTGD
jgi:hypothetical protein